MRLRFKPPGGERSDEGLLESLRAGDEDAFAELVDRHHAALVRLARNYVPSQAVAEEVAQETWLGVLNGLERFEGRSSLKTWLFRILVNRAQTRGERESRTVPFASAFSAEGAGPEPAVDPGRFEGGAWTSPPRPWDDPQANLLATETLGLLGQAIDALPPAQREVIVLRDVEGWSGEEVCNALGISGTNQRVLLHRARSKVRAALEPHLDQESSQ